MAQSSTETWVVSPRISKMWRALWPLGMRVAFAEGQTVFLQQDAGDYFYMIEEGYAQFSILRADGSTLLVETAGPGSIFGEGAAFDRLPRSVTVMAATWLSLIRFDPAVVKTAMAADPEVAASLIALMSAKSRTLLAKLATTSLRTSVERVAELLLRVAAASDGDKLCLTQEQIADMTGLSRVTTSRVLGRLARERAVKPSYRQITILDLDRLRGFAGLD